MNVEETSKDDDDAENNFDHRLDQENICMEQRPDPDTIIKNNK